MSEIGFIKHGKISSEDMAYIVRACNIQMIEQFCPVYGFDPWPVCEYDKLPKDAYPIAFLNDISMPGALGYHNFSGFIYGRVLIQDFCGTSTTASHESLEMRADPSCLDWRRMPDGRDVAYEVCNAVENDCYEIEVDLFGKKKCVPVSNFVLPSWFDPHGEPPYDYMSLLDAPFTMTEGGYMIVREKNGCVSNVFARNATVGALARLAHKYTDPLSRTQRRMLQYR